MKSVWLGGRREAKILTDIVNKNKKEPELSDEVH